MDKIKVGTSTYLTIEGYAKEKGKTIQTIYNWIKENKVETRKMLGQLFVKL